MAVIRTGPGYQAQQDGGLNYSSLGVIGTAGTANVGTEGVVSFSANPATGAQYVEVVGGASGGTVVQVAGGTIQEVGTVLGVGGVVQVNGTVVTGAGTQPVRVIDGTVTSVGSVVGQGTLTNVGSLTNVGTIKELTNIVGGTILNSGTTTGVGVVTSITNIVGGTILNSGTTTGVGVVTALTNGSVNVLTGTVTSVTSVGSVVGVGVVSAITSGTVNTASLATIGNGQTTVTTAGTRVQLGSNACKTVTVKGLPTNLGYIYVGGSTVSSSNGFVLSAGESLSVDITNTNLLYIDSTFNSEGISWFFAT